MVLKETLLTLWDLLRPAPASKPAAKAPAASRKPRVSEGSTGRVPGRSGGAKKQVAKPTRPQPAGSSERPQAGSAQDRYDEVVEMMLAKYNVRVRKWRKSMSGIAWYVTYRDGTISRLIESPKPKGPMSIAIFLHEIGHHAIGFNTYKPRCLEEYHAWAFSIRTMEELGLNVTDAVRDRMYRSLHYAIGKASRRGIKRLPVELEPYVKAPPPRRRRAA